jgi:amyloid beta precursor protein binding protein 1
MQCIQAEGGCNEGGIYIAMLASSMFEDRFHRKPGEASDIRSSEWELDIATLQSLATSIWQDLGLQGKCLATQEILTEMCRCAGASMHCVASVLGGIVAQEAIKVLLRQFVPVRGVLVYDGICASTNVLDV